MGHHGGGEIPEVPHWKIYKVKDVPQMVALKKTLASRNMKDPWLRNYVWLYTEYYNNPNNNKGAFWVLTRGFKYGLGAAIASTLIEHGFLKWYYGDDH